MITSRFLEYSALFLATSSLCLAACGNDDDGVPAGTDADIIDECDSTEVCVQAREGGMVIFEYIGFSAALQAAFPPEIVRNISHFTSAGGDDHVFLTPGTGDGTNGLDECNHLSADDITWPANDVSVQTHVNVGTLTISGGAEDLVIEPTLSGTDLEMTDMISRLHSGAWYQTISPDFGDYIVEDGYHTVDMSGSSEYPATTYEDILYMPSAMTMTNPTGDITVDRPAGGFTEDFTVTWDSGPSANAPDGEGQEILSLVMLVDGTGSNIVEFCVTLNDGEFVIPAAILEEFAAEQPAGGVLLVGNVSHNLGRFDDTGAGGEVNDRRIDFLGMWCEAMAFTINQL